MRVQSILLFAFAASTCFFAFDSQADAQEFKKAMRDYRHEPVFNYQPDDPMTRSKMFKLHTGHYGKFYNCDRQEDKRYSPYICWKTHHENNFPTKMGIRERICHDIAEVKQRISDGAGACQVGCKCNKCRKAAPRRTCDCAECAMAAAPATVEDRQLTSVNHRSFLKPQPTELAPIHSGKVSWEKTGRVSAVATQQDYRLHTPKHGLVAGKILNVRVDDQRPATVMPTYREPTLTQDRVPTRSAKNGPVDIWSKLKR